MVFLTTKNARFYKILPYTGSYGIILAWGNRVTRWKASQLYIRGEVVEMKMFTFQDLILFATFLITLLAYIDSRNKRK